MKLQLRLRWIVIVTLAAGTSAALLSSCSKAPPAEAPSASPEPAAPAAAPAAAPQPEVAQPAATAAPRPAPAAPIVPVEEENKIVFSGDAFDVKSDMVLAKVGGAEIKLKDLVPTVQDTPSEKSMTAKEFESLYQQAIAREVVFQSARVRRMELDEEQRRQVEKSRLRAAREGMALPEAERPEYEARSNFTSLDLMGTLLQRNLVKVFGGPPAEVTPKMIEEYYAAHSADFDKLPEAEAEREAARQKIDEAIRKKLQPDVDAAYQDFSRTMLDDLKKRLSIKEYVVLEK